MKTRTKERIPLSGEEVIQRYFRCIDAKDLGGILDLFDYDAVVFEPFSNIEGGLKGKPSIEPFLKVAMMANSSLQRRIKIEKPSKTNSNKIVALITFEKGDKVKSRFTFEFEDDPAGRKKIKSLHIDFL